MTDDSMRASTHRGRFGVRMAVANIIINSNLIDHEAKVRPSRGLRGLLEDAANISPGDDERAIGLILEGDLRAPLLGGFYQRY
jgi:hypothetical protein